MTAWLVNGAGLLLMAATVAWFWLWPRRPVTVAATAAIDIRVENGVYAPDTIEIRRGQTTTLNFLRVDPSPCAEQVIFHDLGLSARLPVGQMRSVAITPQQTGSYRFTCQMQMYRGTLRVVD